jgi:hypothetical protein
LLGFRRKGQKTLYLFQKHLLCWEYKYIVHRNKINHVKVTFCVFSYNLFLLKVVDTSLLVTPSLTRQLYDNVFETVRKKLDQRTLYFPPDQVAYSPRRCKRSNCLTRTIVKISCNRKIIIHIRKRIRHIQN